MMFFIVGAVVAVLVFPFVVYQSVKLGTFAFYRGKQLFEENRHGEEK